MIRNRKGDVPSFLFAIVSVFVAGIILVVFGVLFGDVFEKLDESFGENEAFNDTVAHDVVQEYRDDNSTMWDYVFLALALAYFFFMMILGFSIRVSNVFFLIYVVGAVFGLFLSAVLSNLWQGMAENPALAADVTANFPITNVFLGSYFPTLALGILLFTMILLFGKFSGGDSL